MWFVVDGGRLDEDVVAIRPDDDARDEIPSTSCECRCSIGADDEVQFLDTCTVCP